MGKYHIFARDRKMKEGWHKFACKSSEAEAIAYIARMKQLDSENGIENQYTYKRGAL